MRKVKGLRVGPFALRRMLCSVREEPTDVIEMSPRLVEVDQAQIRLCCEEGGFQKPPLGTCQVAVRHGLISGVNGLLDQLPDLNEIRVCGVGADVTNSVRVVQHSLLFYFGKYHSSNEADLLLFLQVHPD